MSRKPHCVAVLLVSVHLSMLGQSNEPLSLEKAVDLALRNNPDVLQAQKEIEAATGRVLQAGRIPNPELSVTFNEIPTSLNFNEAGEQDIRLSQTIEFPGKRGSRIEHAEQGKSIAELSLERTKAIVTSNVKGAYYRTLFASVVSDNLRFSIDLVSDFLKLVTDRFRGGSSTYVDVIRAKVELTRLRNEHVEARWDEQLRLSELILLLGRSDTVTLVLSDSLTYTPFGVSQDSVLKGHERQSNLLKMATIDKGRSLSLLNLSQKSYLPDFSLGVALQRRPGRLSPAGEDRYLGFELGLSLPLWFWQGPQGEVQEAEASAEIAAIRFEAVQRGARQRILNAYRRVVVAEEQLRLFQTSLLGDAEEELRSGLAGYQNNQINALDLFDIYRTYRATKFEYARALFNYFSARAALEAAAEVGE